MRASGGKLALCDSQSPWLRASKESMRAVKGCIAKFFFRGRLCSPESSEAFGLLLR